ncbi:MAG: C-terminal binding protein [Candidatus Bathyarchaeia archaeon]
MLARGRPKVVITDHVYPTMEYEKALLEGFGAECEIHQCRSEGDVLRAGNGADVLMVTYAPITRRVLSSLGSLKLIVRHGAGYDNVDLRAATEMGVMVANVPRFGGEEVADHSIALLLALLRKLPALDGLAKAGRWGEWHSALPLPALDGLTLGILGFGRIGQQVARKAKAAFGMNVITYHPRRDPREILASGAEPVGFEDLFRKADALSIHLPLTEETFHLVGEEELRMMKPTAVLVNAGRGRVVDGRALYKALKEGWIAGAGLDVMEEEPPDPKDPLLTLSNVIITPHVAWYSERALRDLQERAAREAIRVLSGGLPENLLNPEALRAKGPRRKY